MPPPPLGSQRRHKRALRLVAPQLLLAVLLPAGADLPGASRNQQQRRGVRRSAAAAAAAVPSSRRRSARGAPSLGSSSTARRRWWLSSWPGLKVSITCWCESGGSVDGIFGGRKKAEGCSIDYEWTVTVPPPPPPPWSVAVCVWTPSTLLLTVCQPAAVMLLSAHPASRGAGGHPARAGVAVHQLSCALSTTSVGTKPRFLPTPIASHAGGHPARAGGLRHAGGLHHSHQCRRCCRAAQLAVTSLLPGCRLGRCRVLRPQIRAHNRISQHPRHDKRDCCSGLLPGH